MGGTAMDVLVEEPKLRNGRSKRTATPPRMAARPWCAGAPLNPGRDPYKEAAALTQPLIHKPKPTKRKSKAPSLPFAQISSMFRERMQSIMLQDKTAVRGLWRRFGDTENKGFITAEQFFKALNWLGVKVDHKDATKFMAKFTEGNSRGIMFNEFYFGILGLPHDFFSMNLSKPPEKEEKGNPLDRQLGALMPSNTQLDTIVRTFRARIRRKLFDTNNVCKRVLRQMTGQSHFDSRHLFNILHNLGITLVQADVDSIMAYYDHDRDGKLHFKEFANDILQLPRAEEVRGKARQPHIQLPNFGNKKVKQALHCVLLNCERASAPPKTIMTFLHGYDADGSGQIAYDEFKLMVRDLNCQAEGKDTAAMLLNYFSPSTGVLNYMQFMLQVLGLRPDSLRDMDRLDKPSTPELISQVASKTKQKLFGTRRAMDKAFAMLDEDRGGAIGRAEFAAGVKNLGLPINGRQADLLFEWLDPDNSGELDATELGHKLQVKDEPLAGQPATQQQNEIGYNPDVNYFSKISNRPLRPKGGGITSRTDQSTISQLLARPHDCGMPSGRRRSSSRHLRTSTPPPPGMIRPPRLTPLHPGNGHPMHASWNGALDAHQSMHRTVPGPGPPRQLSRRSAPPMMDMDTMMHAEFMKRSQSTGPNRQPTLPASMVRSASSTSGFKRIGGQTVAGAASARRLQTSRSHF